MMTRDERGLRLGRHADPDCSILYDSTSKANCLDPWNGCGTRACPAHTPALYAGRASRHRGEA